MERMRSGSSVFYGALKVAGVLGVLYGYASQVVPAGGDGGAESLGYRGYGRLGAALPDAVSGVDERALRFVQGQRDALHVVVGGVAGANFGDAAFDYVCRDGRGAKHTVIDGQVDGADGGSGGDSDGALDGGG